MDLPTLGAPTMATMNPIEKPFCQDEVRLSRPNGKTAVFFKMMVEGKGRLNMKAFHDDKTGTIGKTEIMIGKIFKKVPGLLNNIRGNRFNSKELTSSQRFTKLNGNMRPGSKTDQGIAFVQNIIGGNKGFAFFQKSLIEIAIMVFG